LVSHFGRALSVELDARLAAWLAERLEPAVAAMLSRALKSRLGRWFAARLEAAFDQVL
jgi:hypothetical protein